jgi:hypothetical protein
MTSFQLGVSSMTGGVGTAEKPACVYQFVSLPKSALIGIDENKVSNKRSAGSDEGLSVIDPA